MDTLLSKSTFYKIYIMHSDIIVSRMGKLKVESMNIYK